MKTSQKSLRALYPPNPEKKSLNALPYRTLLIHVLLNLALLKELKLNEFYSPTIL